MKKMAIVPYQLLEEMNRWKSEQQQRPRLPPNPQVTQASHLHQDMNAVLKEDHVSESEKAQLYGQKLQQFQMAHKKALRPKPTKVGAGADPGADPGAGAGAGAGTDPVVRKPLFDRIVDSVPTTMRRKAKLLLQMLEEHPDMSWNEQGRLEVQGKPIDGSNIIDLVNDVLRHRKGSNPRGWEYFSSGLRDMNVPQEYIGNKQRWSWMQRQHSDDYVEDEDGDKFFEASYSFPATPSPRAGKPIKHEPKASGSHITSWEPY